MQKKDTITHKRHKIYNLPQLLCIEEVSHGTNRHDNLTQDGVRKYNNIPWTPLVRLLSSGARQKTKS